MLIHSTIHPIVFTT